MIFSWFGVYVIVWTLSGVAAVTSSTAALAAALGVYPVIAGVVTGSNSSVVPVFVHGLYVITCVTLFSVAVRSNVIDAV